ncbi:MAG: hypothetical protein QQW96_04165 [Tychonema bourrellyi B0820]|uniref:Urease accessory protein UreH-like transmembrane domain-containing protein n=1 Tax=Tychonema bourrellyi FEM_GT703 TaxID=2040638 RepID=A0A2G4F3T8_9CYAN|nr:hypothetical protein [Tychonema bourrellyi]MDQ2096824.1 hypothetical protein [Tychonema bourrellyi B0820]PHX56408.1 hypothetical protein CP500_005710 [Tychonema bourrellyi FEM_GT703]
MESIIKILLGSLALSMIHALIPNHWMPLIAIGKTENWSRSETLRATVITGVAHTLSIILIGIVVGLFGYKFAATYVEAAKIIAPLVLLVLGIIYLLAELDSSRKQHHHHHVETANLTTKRSQFQILAVLGTGMFFSPCIEIEAYYFSAGTIGWVGILVVSVVYLVVTVLGMVLLVDFGMKGVNALEEKLHFFEDHEQGLTGAMLIVLAVVAYFIKV